MIISIHIPKTAGTALALYLDQGLGHSVVFDYGHAIANNREFILGHKALLERYKAIHGHFRYSKYNWAFPDATYVTFLRDPVDRTISNYLHVMRDKDMGNFLYRRIVKCKLDIVDFARLPLVRNAQYQYLRGRDVAAYDFVGNSDEFDASLQSLGKMLSMSVRSPFQVGGLLRWNMRVNVNARARVKRWLHLDGITQDVRRKIAAAVEEDMELYRRGMERFAELKRKYLA